MLIRKEIDKLEHDFISHKYYMTYKYYDTTEKQIKSVAFPSAYKRLKNSRLLFKYEGNIFEVSLSKYFQLIEKITIGGKNNLM